MTMLTNAQREIWDMDVSECPACADLDGDEVCSAHDLDDEDVAAKYARTVGGSADNGTDPEVETNENSCLPIDAPHGRNG